MSSLRKALITARLLAPVAIKRDRQSERSAGVRSVAGTLVRGALAMLYLQQLGQADAAFGRVFLNEAACRFGPLDPEPHVFPLTAVSCKRERLRHALADLLWLRVAQHHLAGPLTAEAEASWRQCARCGADLKVQEGFWRDDGGRPRSMTGDRHETVAHVGIDRRTGTAAESMFYTLEALAPSGAEADLYGWIRADDEAFDTVQRLLRAEDGRISIGHARTRGYGDALLRLGEPTVMEDEHDLRPQVDRWTRWSRELNEVLAAPPFSLADRAPDGFLFGLSFPTGAVLVDRFLRYTLDPAQMIDWLPPMPAVAAAFPLQDRPARRLDTGGAVSWVAAVTKHERLRGWNAAHGLPRQDEWMVARGSAYVYRFEGGQRQREALVARLGTLADDGVGLRRNEGFGVVTVSDEFHRRFHRQEAQQCTC